VSRLEPVLSLSWDSWTSSEHLEAIQDSNYVQIPREIRKFQKKRRIIRRIACTKQKRLHLIFNV